MGIQNLIKSVKIEHTLKKAKKLCKSKRDFDKFIKELIDERNFRELMERTASTYWIECKRKPLTPKQEEQIIEET